MFGVGVQEMVFIGLLFLIIFGPSKLPQMARDLGQFVNEARRAVDEFKEDLTLEEEDGRNPEGSGDSSAKRPSRSRGASGSPSNAVEDRIAPVGTKCNSPGPLVSSVARLGIGPRLCEVRRWPRIRCLSQLCAGHI